MKLPPVFSENNERVNVVIETTKDCAAKYNQKKERMWQSL